MNAFIERLGLPVDDEWNHLITPLQRSILHQISAGEEFQEGRVLIWGVQIRQEIVGSAPIKCGVLIAKMIKFLSPDSGELPFLSVISIAFIAPKISKLLGPMLLQYVIEFASDHGCNGVHIGCPQQGQYGEFVRMLTTSVGSWAPSPGKVVVRLSDIQRVGPLLARLEKAVEYKKGSAQWQIEPYDSNVLSHWQDRIAFSTENNFGIPWDPDDQSYDWEPSDQYSRVLKSNNAIIGWLICHFIADDVLRYGKLWVDPGWEQTGAPLAMLCDVMRSAHFQPTSTERFGKTMGYPVSAGCFISHPSNINLNRFAMNKFKPVCDSWTELKNYYYYFK